MFGIGMTEIIVILIIGLILLGPKKLPGITKSIGKGIIEFKRSLNTMDDDKGQDKKESS